VSASRAGEVVAVRLVDERGAMTMIGDFALVWVALLGPLLVGAHIETASELAALLGVALLLAEAGLAGYLIVRSRLGSG